MGSRDRAAVAPGGRAPFVGEPLAVVVLPERDPSLGGTAALLELEKAEFEAELGAPVEISTSDPGAGARWLLLLDDAAEPPSTAFDPAARLIVSRARDAGGLVEAISLWRTVSRAGGGTVAAVACDDVEQAIERVRVEVADTYPAFALRGLDWGAICARHVPQVRGADDPLPALQRWLAELQDGHTWARVPVGNLPYALRVERSGAVFVRVPAGTPAAAAGVAPGWRLLAVDDAAADVDDWLARTGAPPHSLPLVAGRRLLAGPAGTPRSLTVAAPDGRRASWEEAATPTPADPLVVWRPLPPAAGYVRVEAWVDGRGVDEALDAAFADLRGRDPLVLDLRGNAGGNLVLACRTRDRFVRGRTELGAIRYSVGDGRLSRPFPLVGTPAADARRWPGRLVVLTDPLTFSASEDFLLGLQGLDHVRVVGRRSGGGSGRPRTLRLLRGSFLTVSTALTHDRQGRCVEGAGVPVDLEVHGSDDDALAADLRLA